MKQFTFKYVNNSIKGIDREENQDRTYIIDTANFTIFMLFDGVGSLPESAFFIEQFISLFKSKLRKTDSYHSLKIIELLTHVNMQTLKLGINGMSTLSMLYFNKSKPEIQGINIGDSRIYNFNNQFLEKLTDDDSLYEGSNYITKCLGIHELIANDFKSYSFDPFSNYLICSDGFYKLMEKKISDYFKTFNYRYLKNIEKKIFSLQKNTNKDDSSYILIKNEISNRNRTC